MNKLLLSAAMAGIFAAGINAATAAETEKCYGIAKAGKNNCSSADGSHSCAGQATKDNDPNEWVSVGKGECEGMGGKLSVGGADKNGCQGKDAEKK